MKNWSALIVMLAACISICYSQESSFKYIDNLDGENYYLIKSSVKKSSAGYFIAWLKVIPEQSQLQKIRKEIGAKNSDTKSNYSKYDHRKLLVYIDCGKELHCMAGYFCYDVNGNVIYYATGTDWDPIPPDSFVEKLTKYVCKK